MFGTLLPYHCKKVRKYLVCDLQFSTFDSAEGKECPSFQQGGSDMVVKSFKICGTSCWTMVKIIGRDYVLFVFGYSSHMNIYSL